MHKLILTTFFILLINTTSYAYLGPGVGGGIIAATIGIVIAFFAALFGLIWFPLKRIIKNKQKKKERDKNSIE